MLSEVLHQCVSFQNYPSIFLTIPKSKIQRNRNHFCFLVREHFTCECKINENLKHKKQCFNKEFKATRKFPSLLYYMLDLPHPDTIFLKCFNSEKERLIAVNKPSENSN